LRRPGQIPRREACADRYRQCQSCGCGRRVANEHVFLPATAPSGVGINEYYKSDEDYFHALAAEMAKEYRAIVDAGVLVQIDDPFLPDIFFELGRDDSQKKRRAPCEI